MVDSFCNRYHSLLFYSSLSVRGTPLTCLFTSPHLLLAPHSNTSSCPEVPSADLAPAFRNSPRPSHLVPQAALWFPRLPHVPPFRFNSFLLVGTCNGFWNHHDFQNCPDLPELISTSGTRPCLPECTLPSGTAGTRLNFDSGPISRRRCRLMFVSLIPSFTYSILFHVILCCSVSFYSVPIFIY